MAPLYTAASSSNLVEFFFGSVTLIIKSKSRNESNATYISHHLMQPHNRQILGLKSWLYARYTRIFFFKFLKFTSLNKCTAKKFLYSCHNLTDQAKRIYSDVNNYERIIIKKLCSWKDDRHQGWSGNKIFHINTLRQQTLSSFSSYSTVQEKGCL